MAQRRPERSVCAAALQGQTLSVYVRGTSGNLDPFVALVDGHLDDQTLERRLAELDGAGGRDLLTVLPELADELFLAWDDDGGQGYGGSFAWTVPADVDDQQSFAIRFVSLFPESEYVYAVLPDFSRLGLQLGEEEWLTTSFATLVDSIDGRARFSYMFEAERHLTYYPS